MRLKATLSGIAIAVTTALVGTGCSAASSTATSSAAVSTAVSTSASPADSSTLASSASEPGATFPVTITHAFGEAVIDTAPSNVVTWGWGSTDASIALGVIPVAIPFQSYGGDEKGVLPWIAEALTAAGAATPTVLPESAEEPPYEEIAKANPDLILAVYSGITAKQYELLAAIAPTVAYPDAPWSTPWRDVVTTVGTALGKASEAATLLAAIDGKIAAAATAHPEFAGTSIAAVWDVANTFYVYRKEDPRVAFLLDLGFTSAPSVDALANGESSFYYTLSYEQLDKLDADVIVSYSDTQAEADAFLTSTKTLAIPAVASGNVAQPVGTSFIASVSPPTALSLTWGMDTLVTSLAAAVAR